MGIRCALLLAGAGLLTACHSDAQNASKGEDSVVVAPYRPEPHGGVGDVVGKVSETVLRMNVALPAVSWSQAISGVEKKLLGRLPTGWTDGTTDLRAAMSYGRMIEDGIPYLNWNATSASAESGAVRLTGQLPRLAKGTLYRIAITARSTTRTPVRLQVRLPEQAEITPALNESLPLANTWDEYHFDWISTVDSAQIPLTLEFLLEKPGNCDLASVEVSAMDVERLRQELNRSQGESSTNYLRATRFPLGLPSKWMINRTESDGDEVKVTSSPAVIGPSGIRALHIEARLATSLYGEPFVASHFWLPQEASFYIKGKAQGSLVLYSAGTAVARTTFNVTNDSDWKSIRLGFAPKGIGDELYLGIELEGGAWIDSLRVGPAGTPESVEPVKRTEVALSSPRATRVVFSDEKPEFRFPWAVMQAPAGSVLKGKVVSLYDEQIALPEVKLGSGSLTEGQWTLPVFPLHSLGAFRVEAWVEDGKGRRLSPYDEIVFYRLSRPHYWGQDAPESPFGTHLYSVNRHLEMAKSIGVNWVRTHDAGISYVGWYFLEPQPGQWSFRDEPIERYRQHHLMILGQLGTAPAWASALRRVGPISWTDRYYQPENLEAFRNYVKTVTSRYRQSIQTWEIWNEPWLAEFWKKGAERDGEGRWHYVMGNSAPEDFARLTAVASETAKQVDPELKIVGFNTTAGSHSSSRNFAGNVWTQRVKNAGGLQSVDVVSYHQYAYECSGYPGDAMEKGYHTAVDVLRDADGRQPKPVWLTEGSAVQGLTGKGFYYHGLPLPQQDNYWESSDRLCRYVIAALGAGSEKVFLYSMHKYGYFDNGRKFRVLLSEDGYLHPSAAAYSAMTRFLEDRKFVRTVEVRSDLLAYLFQGKDSWTIVMCPRPGRKAEGATYPVRFTGMESYDLFGNPLSQESTDRQALYYLLFPKSAEESSVIAALSSSTK